MKILKRHKKFKFINQNGQTAVFFALLLPVLILFLFVVFDLGWLYLNKSRLQNAAEAAAIAGANKFSVESDTGYNTVMLIYEDDDDYKKLLEDYKTEFPNDSEGPEFPNGLDDKVPKAKSAAKDAATASFNDNLGVGNDPENPEKDSWTKAKVNVTTLKVFGKTTSDLKIYYAVKINEDVGHIFKFLKDSTGKNIFSTEITGVAVAVLTKERSLLDDTTHLPIPVPNWEIQDSVNSLIKKNSNPDYVKNIKDEFKVATGKTYFEGNWMHFQDPDVKVHYADGNSYKTENIEVNFNSSSLKKTRANNDANYSADEVDALNIDFKQDVTLDFDNILQDDWDIDFDLTGTGIKKVSVSAYRDKWGTSELNFRIHSTINFSQPYNTRTPKSEGTTELYKRLSTEYKDRFGENKDTFADPLYIGIESEPMKSNLYKKTDQMHALNSVRQIILNINESNMDNADVEKIHEYKYRPLVIIYEGPEKNDETSARVSQPVIVNLKADFRGILYMPNSPVVINGNGKKFQGYIIAKEFRQLKTESDYIKFTREIDNKPIYIEDVYKDTKPDSTDDKIMVRKPDTYDWVQVDKNKLLYFSDYTKVAASNSFVSVQNETGTEYTFTYTKTDYIIKNSDLEKAKDANDYETEKYYRCNLDKNPKEKPTPAYVKKDLTKGDFVDATLNDKGQWVNGTLTPSDTQIIAGKREHWYEIKIREDKDNIWSTRSKATKIEDVNDYLLLYTDNWRIITDENTNKQYITKTSILNKKLSNYVEVTDAEGNPAYILKSDWDNAYKVIYFKIYNNSDKNRYCVKNSFDYFFKKSNEDPLIIDYHGNVQYTDKLTSDYIYPEAQNAIYLDDNGKSPGFKPEIFNLDTDIDDTHYSRCGAVPIRQRYTALDAFERNKPYCQDMFFEKTRARYVV